MIEATPAPSSTERVAEVHERAARRVRRQRDSLRPLGWAVMLVVAAELIGGHPQPGTHGKALALTVALLAFTAALAVAIRGRFAERSYAIQGAVVAAMGAAAVALVALQTDGTSELAVGAAVWMAVTRLPLRPGTALGVALTAALDVAAALTGSSPASIVAGTLVVTLLGLVAYFIRRSRSSQEHTELLLAQLEDAREEQARTVALEERSRIAGELHDVLAHSLSGAAIQLEAARKLADRDRASPPVHAAIERAGQLVREGLASARQAVGALRGEALPGVAQLNSLVNAFGENMGVPASLTTEGCALVLTSDASLALYRGAQEALTNVARHAPGAAALVSLRYSTSSVSLSIENGAARAGAMPEAEVLRGLGGGRGLTGLRERIEQLGGTFHAGPTETGWRVDLVVPA